MVLPNPNRRPGFKSSPPPPAPRDVPRRTANVVGLWVMRLFILPHVLVGLGLLVAMVFMPLWQSYGTTSAAVVKRVYTSTTTLSARSGSKIRTVYHVEYFDPL